MRDAETPQAVRNKQGIIPNFRYSLFKGIHPLVTDRIIPIPLLHPNTFRVRGLPERLPMRMIRVADSWKNNSRHIHVAILLTISGANSATPLPKEGTPKISASKAWGGGQ